MLWLIYTTGECNLRCSYCGGSFNPSVVPWEVKYSLEDLKKLVESDSDATVIFYGGEPLLNAEFMMKVMDGVRAKRFGVQTNGTVIDALPASYWKRMSVVLLSIDGRESVTDSFRGKGVYKRVVSALRALKEAGVGKIIARMTVTSKTDIYEDVSHLFSLGFDYVHWQINAVWSKIWNIRRWGETSYIPGIIELKEAFLREAERGRVLGIVPFLGILSAHYFKPYEGPPCGSGYRAVSVSTDGRILACPIAVYERWAELGSVKSGFKLMKIELPDACKSCEYLRYCGGRCLYSIKEGEKLWGKSFWDLDYITRETIKAVLSMVPELDELIEEKILDRSSFYYDPVLDSTEVIP